MAQDDQLGSSRDVFILAEYTTKGGATPITSKKRADTCDPINRSGGPEPMRLKPEPRLLYAARSTKTCRPSRRQRMNFGTEADVPTTAGITLHDLNEPIGFGKRERAQQQRIDRREDYCCGADRQREGQDDRERKARLLAQHPRRVAQRRAKDRWARVAWALQARSGAGAWACRSGAM